MQLKIAGTDELLFEDEIYEFKAKALDGWITIQEKHQDYLSILQKGLVEITQNKSNQVSQKIGIQENSILFIENNVALIFC